MKGKLRQIKLSQVAVSILMPVMLVTSGSIAESANSTKSPSDTSGVVKQSCSTEQIKKLLDNFSEASSQKQLAECGESAVPHLTQILRISQDLRSQKMAIEVLSKIGGTDVTKVLTQIAKNSQDAYIRGVAVEAIVKIGGADVTKVLIQIASADQDTNVRITAAEALGKIGEADVAKKVLIQIARNGQDGKDTYVRESAVEAMVKIGGADVTKALIRIASKDQDPLLRVSTVEALGIIGGADVAKVLIQLARNDEVVRDIAVPMLVRYSNNSGQTRL
jgi:HEAT repeat protein